MLRRDRASGVVTVGRFCGERKGEQTAMERPQLTFVDQYMHCLQKNPRRGSDELCDARTEMAGSCAAAGMWVGGWVGLMLGTL